MSAAEHKDIRAMVYIAALFIGFGLMLITSRAHAQDLPDGITCAQVVRYAATLDIPNTRWGRAQARVIAATFGIYVTGAQLDAAARCLKEARAR